MEYKNATEQKMVATFAYKIISSLFTQPDGISILKKLFLSSLLTPKDVLAQARRTQLRRGTVKAAIYEDIQYALYVEMRDNQDSRIPDTLYEYLMQTLSHNSHLQKAYKQGVKTLQNGKDIKFAIIDNYSNFMFSFCFLYEKIPLTKLTESCIIQLYQYLVQSFPLDDVEPYMDILHHCYCDTMPVRETKVYNEGKQAVRQALAEYVNKRYSANTAVTTENLADYIAKKIHTGIHDDDTSAYKKIDSLDPNDEVLFYALNFLGMDNYDFSFDMLRNVMGDSNSNTWTKGANHHPDVGKLIDLAFDSSFSPYAIFSDKNLTRAIIRKEIVPSIIDKIEAFYERIVMMYYADCVYNVVQQYRDEYYYNFHWFYDIEKQDAVREVPVSVAQPAVKKEVNDRYATLNAQYERERKRVNEVCKMHAHELAEKDRAISAQTNEIEILRTQLRIQQEFYNLASASEEPDVAETLDISSLYGKRFLFVGKLHESNAKLKQTFPTSTFMETDTANIKSLKVDGVVFLIRNMGHSMYYKVMQNNQFAELPKIYCNSRNINNIYQAMLNSAEK